MLELLKVFLFLFQVSEPRKPERFRILSPYAQYSKPIRLF